MSQENIIKTLLDRLKAAEFQNPHDLLLKTIHSDEYKSLTREEKIAYLDGAQEWVNAGTFLL